MKDQNEFQAKRKYLLKRTVHRLNIPPNPGDDYTKFYLLLSFDISSDATAIIERKVMPQIENIQEIFM